MKLTIRTIAPMLLATTAVSGVALADSHAPQPSWMGYEPATTYSQPISKSYNEYSKQTTTTDNSKRAKNSFNRSTEFDLDIDASRRMDDSYNTDNSKRAYESFNTDKSRRAYDSYNTDKSRHAKNSYNTDKSTKDSYNTQNNQRKARITDTMAVNPYVNSVKKVSSGDVQGASNSGYLSGHSQMGYQGGVDVGGIGNDAPTYNSGYGYGEGYGYGGGYGDGGDDNRTFSNTQKIRMDGPNFGAVSNTSSNTVIENHGRDMVFGPNRSAIGNDFGNKQIFTAGDQAQLQKNDLYKSGDNSAAATDNVITTATKTSKTTTQ